MKIVNAPDSVLSEVAKPCGKIDKGITQLILEMKKTLNGARDPQGVGLAAPQVGKGVRIFIAKPTEKSKIQVFINPVIDSISQELTPLERPAKSKSPTKLEGCLSLPSIWGTVLRNPSLTLSYLDENGISYKKTFTGFMATIIQHEMDHLNGILFPKRVLEQKGKLFKSSRNQKGEDEFEEIEI